MARKASTCRELVAIVLLNLLKEGRMLSVPTRLVIEQIFITQVRLVGRCMSFLLERHESAIDW